MPQQKLGLLLARVRESRIDLHWLRLDEVTGFGGPLKSGWRNVVTRLPSTPPDSPLALTLAHPLATRTEIPLAWPSAIRQQVRNDYPLLACLELGAAAVKSTVTTASAPAFSHSYIRKFQ